MRNTHNILFLLVSLLWLSACSNTPKGNSKLVARVYNKNLYLSDIADIFPDNITKEDSIQILSGYVDRWVRKQLLLTRAEKNLSNNHKDVTKQIEDYRSSLLIFKFEQEFIRQKLDTIITFEEIEKFYNDNTSNFALNESIVKALFVKIRMDDPYYEKILSMYRSTKEEDIQALDNIAYQVAIKYDYFNDEWIPLSQILRELPETLDNPEYSLITKKYIEMNNENISYLVSLRDIIHKGQQSPLAYEKHNIRSIILNKRKQKLILDMETNLYNDARNYNNFEIYTD